MDSTPRRLQRFYRRGESPPADSTPQAPVEHASPPARSQASTQPPRSKAEEKLLDEMSSILLDESAGADDPLETIEANCHAIALREVHAFFLTNKRMPSREEMNPLVEKIAAELATSHPLPKPENAGATTDAPTRARDRHRHREEKTVTPSAPVPVAPSPAPIAQNPVSSQDLHDLFSDAKTEESASDEIKPLDENSDFSKEDSEGLLSLEDEPTEKPSKKKEKP